MRGRPRRRRLLVLVVMPMRDLRRCRLLRWSVLTMSNYINRAARAMDPDAFADRDPQGPSAELQWAVRRKIATDHARALDTKGLLATYPHLEVEGDWLIEVVNEHTCGAGPGSGYGCEPGCGTVPVGRLLTPEVEAKIAARALRDAVADLDRRVNDPALIEAADRYSGYYAGVRSAMQRESQLLLDRIECEGGAS